MDKQESSEITQALGDWNDGDEDAKERLVPLVYDELKRQASFLMAQERSEHTLQPTALVHEAFLRITEETGIEWRDRYHFYGIASHVMRQILVQHARKHATAKRGGNQIHLSIDDVQIPIEKRSGSIIALHEALEKLKEQDERHAKIVEMRFFGGFENEEIAQALEISVRTVIRAWNTSRVWLYRELDSASSRS